MRRYLTVNKLRKNIWYVSIFKRHYKINPRYFFYMIFYERECESIEVPFLIARCDQKVQSNLHLLFQFVFIILPNLVAKLHIFPFNYLSSFCHNGFVKLRLSIIYQYHSGYGNGTLQYINLAIFFATCYCIYHPIYTAVVPSDQCFNFLFMFNILLLLSCQYYHAVLTEKSFESLLFICK